MKPNALIMQCCQCPKSAIIQIGDQGAPLCVDCYLKFQQANAIQQEQNERMIDYLSAEMEAMVGLPPVSPRFGPRARPVHVQGATFNNIKLKNSSVGLLNSGTIGSVDSAITVIASNGDAGPAKALQTLSQAIINSADLPDEKKNELLESLSLVSAEASLPAAQRRKGPMRAILRDIATTVGATSGLMSIWNQVGDAILSLFA